MCTWCSTAGIWNPIAKISPRKEMTSKNVSLIGNFSIFLKVNVTKNYPKVFSDSLLFRSWSLVFRTVSYLRLSFLVEKWQAKKYQMWLFFFFPTTISFFNVDYDPKNCSKMFVDGSLFRSWLELDVQVIILPLPSL